MAFSQQLKMLFICGGQTEIASSPRCHLFKLDHQGSNSFFSEVGQIPDCPFDELVNCSATFHGQDLYVFGGQADWRINQGCFSNRLFKLNLQTLAWQEIAAAVGQSAPCPRSQSFMFTHSNDIFIYGGYNGIQIFNDVHKFSLEHLTWSRVGSSGQPPSSMKNLRMPPDGQASPDFSPLANLFDSQTLFVMNQDFESNLYRIHQLHLKSMEWNQMVKMPKIPSRISRPSLISDGSRLCIVQADKKTNKTVVHSLKLSQKLTWAQQRVLWLACLKNEPEICPLAKCPPMIIYNIISLASRSSS